MLISSIVPKLPTHPNFSVVDIFAAADFGWEYLIQDVDGLWILEEFLPSAETPQDLATLQTELQQWIQPIASIRFPQLARSIAILSFDERLFWLREHIPGQSYQQLLTQAIAQNDRFSEAEVWDFLIDVLQPLAALHDQNIAHGAIDFNAVICRESDGNLVLQRFGGIREFGLAHQFYLLQPLMTPSWQSNLRGLPQDLHDLAWMALVLLTGNPELELISPVLHTLQRDAVISDELARILTQMLLPKPWQQFPHARAVLQALEAELPQDESFPAPIVPPTPATPNQPTAQQQPTPPSIPSPLSVSNSPASTNSTNLPNPPEPPTNPAPPRSPHRDPIIMTLSIVFIGLVTLSLWRIVQSAKIPFLTPKASPTKPIDKPVGKFSGQPITNTPKPKPSLAAIATTNQPAPTASTPAAKSATKPTKSPAKHQPQTKHGIAAALYDQLIRDIPQGKQAPQQKLNPLLKQLSEAARREMGGYYRQNYDRWFATLATKKISQPTVDILTDTSFYMRFPSLQKKSLNPRTFGQIWYAIARDHITALNQKQNLKRLKAGSFNESGKLHHGQGRVFHITVPPGSGLKLYLKTSKKDIRLSVIQNEIILTRYSTNTQWTAPKSKHGAIYEIILTPMRTEAVPYKLSLKQI
ncbi:hypothetical protein IQ266_09860 [filamentous cyanobacterium LEGE 11480]|uniref:Protein kinase domain-containing protein n=1 Tax=Romeriopsis navalis LEGE 11480 TaxID=2777977 RepID=A0A928Z3H4_9CYAN|nr:hypothetical protein [Romeriopsis navalis]MBE9030032.1 hypothetical protein [Romeriopsis navalis LEGE 11480]